MSSTPRSLDLVEAEYERAMARAGTNEALHELSIGLAQYREMYKLPADETEA